MGPISGLPISVGICALAWISFSDICCLAQYRSTSSANTIVTNDKPNLEKLLIALMPDILLQLCSIGNVTKRSISSAP